MKRILLYPSLTNYENHEQDTFLKFLRKLISSMSLIRDDIYWYCAIPSKESGNRGAARLIKKYLNFKNTKHIHLVTSPLPRDLSNLNYSELKKIKWMDYAIDAVFVNYPQHASNLKKYFLNQTKFEPSFVGFNHFHDFPDILKQKSVLRLSLVGILDMKVCYINSKAEKDHLLELAGRTFNVNIIRKLNNILKIFPKPILPISENDTSSFDIDPLRIIVFNHQPNLEKSFPLFCAAIEELWMKRKDFRVWVPFYEKRRTPFEWMITDIPKETPDKYYYGLRRCCVGISPRQLNGDWVVSTATGLLSGLPYIVYDDPVYKKLSPEIDTYKNRRQLNKLISFYLDNTEYRNKKVKDSLKNVHNSFMLNEITNSISKQVDSIFEGQKKIVSVTARKLSLLIKSESSISQRRLLNRLGWDNSRKFNGYRKYLLDDKQIIEEPDNWKSIYRLV